MSRDIIMEAWSFANKAHIGQVRRYTGEPYIVHPVAVASLVKSVIEPDAENYKTMICAALLHDVVEDTLFTNADIARRFGEEIAELVDELTDVSRPEDGNRAIRKNLDLIHLSTASPDAKTIKLADLIDNSKTIILYGKEFTPIYMREKRALLEVLKEGHVDLYVEACETTENYFGGE